MSLVAANKMFNSKLNVSKYELFYLRILKFPFPKVEMFYLNTIEQLFLFVEQLDQLEVCLPHSRLLTGIPKLAVFQNLRWNSNKTSLFNLYLLSALLLLHFHKAHFVHPFSQLHPLKINKLTLICLPVY